MKLVRDYAPLHHTAGVGQGPKRNPVHLEGRALLHQKILSERYSESFVKKRSPPTISAPIPPLPRTRGTRPRPAGPRRNRQSRCETTDCGQNEARTQTGLRQNLA